MITHVKNYTSKKNKKKKKQTDRILGQMVKADSLCYKAVTNAPLWGNCPPIKMLKKAKKAPKVIRKKKKRKEKCKLW